ncbi:MAG: type II toxin-antitoxin system ParD family antitoxin [Acidobacteriota bacterium]
MASLHVSLSDEMRSFVDEQVEGGAYHNHSEYVRDLIRHDQARQERERVDALLLEGLASGVPSELETRDWFQLRERLRTRAQRSDR